MAANLVFVLHANKYTNKVINFMGTELSKIKDNVPVSVSFLTQPDKVIARASFPILKSGCTTQQE